jgi:hypothetical protein
MSRAFGYGQLKSQLNSLQSLVLSNQGGGGGPSVTPTLGAVMGQGNVASFPLEMDQQPINNASEITLYDEVQAEGVTVTSKGIDLIGNGGYGIESQVLTSGGPNGPMSWTTISAFAAEAVSTPILNATGMSVPIQINGTTYYVQLFTQP